MSDKILPPIRLKISPLVLRIAMGLHPYGLSNYTLKRLMDEGETQ